MHIYYAERCIAPHLHTENLLQQLEVSELMFALFVTVI